MDKTLTVGELIERLKDFDHAAPVHRLIRSASYGPLEDVATRRLATLPAAHGSIVVDIEDPMWDDRQEELGEPFEAVIL